MGRRGSSRRADRADSRSGQLPDGWPEDVTFLADYVWSDDVSAPLVKLYGGKQSQTDALERAPREAPPTPCDAVFVAAITDSSHPAHGQHGLFARRCLEQGEHVLDYLGRVSEAENRSSDYVVDFGEHSELALDGLTMGSEARFINDYRNTGRHPNVEFRLWRGQRGELRQGVFVCAKRVREGDELLISYGRSYWKARVGDLEAFIYRRPGEEST